MNESFKHFFNACQPEFKSLHGVSWESKPELYYQYLQTRYLAMIAESLGPGLPATDSLKAAMGGVKSPSTAFAAGFDDEGMKPKAKKTEEHIET